MSFSPFARYRNFNLDNLKSLLQVYPDMAESIPWGEASDTIEVNLRGYKKTAYQQACQFGLEDRGQDNYRVQKYLYTFDDDNLIRYIKFWIKTYYAPNPYVNSNDEPIMIYYELAKCILESSKHEVDFYSFFNNRCGGKSDDILLNVLKSYGQPLSYRKDGDKHIFFVVESSIMELEKDIRIIEEEFQIGDAKSRKEFFERYTYDNFCKFYGIDNNNLKTNLNDDINNEFDMLMFVDNKEFIFKCLDIMKNKDLFNKYTLDILTDKEKCAKLFYHNSLNGILYKINQNNDENKQRLDANGNSRYYSDKYIIEDIEYWVSSEWKADRENARKPLIDWIKSLLVKIKFNTGYQSEFSRNRIVFGAPGTGKSYRLNRDKDILLSKGSLDYERVTFHPSYSYANFVGTYKPVSKKGENGVNEIVYEYVPGPFMRIYVKALENSKDKNNIKPFLLLIEEINRANVAAVFGEVFQLLDRNSDNVSEYSIHATEDMKQYLAEQLQGNPEDFAEIKIPDNMFIWATMNSADQGVLPMDTAFKRRWDFEYISVDDEEQVAVIQDYEIPICIDNTYYVKWQELRDGINTILKAEKVNEDKLLGPFFISRTMLENINMVKETRNKIDAGEIYESEVIADISNKEKTFIKAFESKVIMYLFEDVMKMRPGKIFIGYDKNKGNMIFSEICQAFEKYGEKIFDLQLKNND